MVRDKKIKLILLSGMVLSVGWCFSLLAQTPVASEVKAAVAKDDIPSMPQPDSSKDAWKPEQPAKDAKVGVWKLVEAGAANVDLKLKKIAVGDAHDVWAVGENNKVYKLTAKGWTEKVAGVDVAATEDGTILLVNDKDELLMLNKKGGWDVAQNIKAKTVAAGNKDAVWVSYQGQIFHFDDAKWEKVKNMLGQDATGLTFFTINAEEVVYALDDKNSIYRRDLDRVEQVQKTSSLRAQVVEKQKKEKEERAKRKKARKSAVSKASSKSKKSASVAKSKKEKQPKAKSASKHVSKKKVGKKSKADVAAKAAKKKASKADKKASKTDEDDKGSVKSTTPIAAEHEQVEQVSKAKKVDSKDKLVESSRVKKESSDKAEGLRVGDVRREHGNPFAGKTLDK